MTLENCKIMLAQYEANGDEENAEIFKARIAMREKLKPKAPAPELKSDKKA